MIAKSAIILFNMNDSLNQTRIDPSIEARLLHLNSSFTSLLYTQVCRALFQKHQLLFSFLLTISVLQGTSRAIPPV